MTTKSYSSLAFEKTGFPAKVKAAPAAADFRKSRRVISRPKFFIETASFPLQSF
jgi:hypothetical protein